MVGVQLHRLLLPTACFGVIPLLVLFLDNVLLIAVLAIHEVIAPPIFSSVVGAFR